MSDERIREAQHAGDAERVAVERRRAGLPPAWVDGARGYAECDPAIFKTGLPVLMLTGPRSWLIDRWLREVVKRKDVDWHMAGGRAVFKALPGDWSAALRALVDSIPALEEASAFKLDDGHELDWRPLQVVGAPAAGGEA